MMHYHLLQPSTVFFTNLPNSPFPTSNPPPNSSSSYVSYKKDASFPLQFSTGLSSVHNYNEETSKLQVKSLELANQSSLALKLYSDLISKHDLDEAKRVLDHMLHNRFNLNAATFTALIDAFCRRGKLQKAFEILDLMTTNGIQPTVQTYNCLLKGLCYVGRVEEAFELMEDIKKSAIKPDIYTYTAMMNGFCKVGRSNEAMELLNEAIELGLKPSVVTFHTLFHGYTKEGKPLEGINVLKKMKQEQQCTPDYISYSTLIRGLLIWKNIKAAQQVYQEMLESGYEGDERLMNSFLRGLCRKYVKDNVMLEDAYQVFDEMRKRGCVFDQSSYCLVVKALSIGKRVEDALVILQEMIGVEYVPRMSIVNRIIRRFCIEGKMEKAVLVLVLVIICGTHKVPNRMSYDLIIRELNRQGRFLEACSVYNAALVRGTVPNNEPQQN